MFDKRLTAMLSYRRPHGSKTEREFVERFIMPYQPEVLGTDEPMAYVVLVGEPNRVLFSAHVDTVHRKGGRQKLVADHNKLHLFKTDGKPLGADDGAGCWLLLEMIDAQIPGTYVFHRGEECGGIGSGWIAEHGRKFLQQHDYAIAFDRKATHSVITHQGYGRCCSDTFAESLADALNAAEESFMYTTDDSGLFTDTALYTDEIAECTNVSCGYYNEHTDKEWLDVGHLTALRNACLKIDWTALPVARKPGEIEHLPGLGFSRYTTTSDYRGKSLWDMSYEDMQDMAWSDPQAFADLVYEEIGQRAYT